MEQDCLTRIRNRQTDNKDDKCKFDVQVVQVTAYGGHGPW